MNDRFQGGLPPACSAGMLWIPVSPPFGAEAPKLLFIQVQPRREVPPKANVGLATQ